MKILITLFYNSEQGGLHDNVFSNAVESKNRGYEVYVACRKGVFQDQLIRNGINIVEIDQKRKIWSVNNIIKEIGTDIDLIHAHPGISREIALLLHDEYGIPIIYHVHGAWTDSINHYVNKLDSIFAVSESVKKRITDYCKSYSHIVHVIPNYSDYDPIDNTELIKNTDYKTITLISRLEYDKRLIVDKVKKMDRLFNNIDERIVFNIVGTGSLEKELKDYFNSNIDNDKVEINFDGWISDKKELRRKILKSDIVIGPGRVAIDAYRLGVPVIVVGSQNYYGVINENNWQEFVSSNFGGLGPKPNTDGNIEEDVKALLFDEDKYLISSQVGQKVIDTFFDKEKTLEKQFNIYDIILHKK